MTSPRKNLEDPIENIAETILYEGYLLYPYRASAPKNQHRFQFGTLAPRDWCESALQNDSHALITQCLLEGDDPGLTIRVRFLHTQDRQIGKLRASVNELTGDFLPDYEPVASLEIDDTIHQTWQEAVEREIRIEIDRVSQLGHAPMKTEFSFPPTHSWEPLRQSDGRIPGLIVRRQSAVRGRIEVFAEQLESSLFKVRVVVQNETPLENPQSINRDEAMRCSLASTHAILKARSGEFVSLLEPPARYSQAVENCENHGWWPVLVGEAGDQSVVLASPIILYDYPQIAPESQGDFFDGTEIDEMLALRVMTLTEEEKQQTRGVDDRAHQLLERTDGNKASALRNLHGAMRKPRP